MYIDTQPWYDADSNQLWLQIFISFFSFNKVLSRSCVEWLHLRVVAYDRGSLITGKLTWLVKFMPSWIAYFAYSVGQIWLLGMCGWVWITNGCINPYTMHLPQMTWFDTKSNVCLVKVQYHDICDQQVTYILWSQIGIVMLNTIMSSKFSKYWSNLLGSCNSVGIGQVRMRKCHWLYAAIAFSMAIVAIDNHIGFLQMK